MRVAVVGGGIAGLAAGALIARAGHRVKLFEKAGEAGGRALTQARQGFALNLGPHALYRGGPAERVLGELGVRYAGGAPSGAGYAIEGGALRGLPVGLVSLLSTSLLSLPAKLEVGALLARLPRIDASALMHDPVEAWIDGAARAPDARAFLRALLRVTTYSGALDRFSAGVALGTLQRVLAHNVLYLDDGWSTLVRGLEEAARAAGVDVVMGERASGVELDEGSVARVLLASGHASPVDAVVLATSPRAAAALCPSSAALARTADESVPATAACLDIALSRLPVPRARFALGIDRPTYFSVHSVVAKLAPAGGAVVHAALYDEGTARDPREAERELEALVDLLQPGWRDAVVERRFMPKLVVTNAIPTAEAGGYLGRAPVEVPDARGLFVAGDWVGREGCLADAALGSASEAARAVSTLERRPRGSRRDLTAVV